MNNREILLLGAGGHCSDVLSVIEAQHAMKSPHAPTIITVADEGEPPTHRFEGRNVVIRASFILGVDPPTAYIATVGYPEARQQLVARATQNRLRPAPALIHPGADLGAGVAVGSGSVIFGQVWISPLVSVGEHSFVSYGSTIGHDTRIGNYVSVMPGSTISGSVTVDDGALIGAGAVLLEGIHIGEQARVGAGAVVTDDVGPGATVVGVPARSLAPSRRATP